MNHTLNMLADSLQRMLADTVEHRSTLEAERTGIDLKVWEQLSDIGVVGEDASVMSAAELAVVAEALGYAGALVPYVESEAMGRWLASAAEWTFDSKVLTVAVVEDETKAINMPDGGAQLSLKRINIPWACRAERVLFSFRVGSRCYVGAKHCSDIHWTSEPSLAGEPHGLVASDEITLRPDEVREVSEARGPEATLQRAAMFRTVQMLGAMTRVNELTLQYARDRKQFRRSLSDFQVIQSYLAAMAGELCAVAGVVQVAIDNANGEAALETTAVAKIRAGQAARQITQMGHQVHGAIGFTQEYPLNLWSRRLWSWREEFGNEAQWAAKLGAAVISRGADALWPCFTQQSEVMTHE